MTKLRTQLNENQKRLSDIMQEKGVSNWLKAYPINDKGMISTNNNFGTVFIYVMAGN